MLRIVLLISFVVSLFAAGQDDAIAWSATRRLTWDDFQGKAVRQLDGAQSALNTAIAVGCREGVLQFRVVMQFLPRQSFVAYRITSSGLASRAGIEHEQIHFDLAEVYARRIRKMYAELPAPCPRSDEALSAMADRLLSELSDIQRRYELETRAGENGARQADWIKRVAADLAALEKFKDAGADEHERASTPPPGGGEARRAFEAMMPMKKIDIATIEAARRVSECWLALRDAFRNWIIMAA